MTDLNHDDFLTVPETAELLKVSAVTVSRWLKQGRLPAYRVGPRAVRIRRFDIDELLAPASSPVAAATAATNANGRATSSRAPAATNAPPTMDEQRAVLEEMATLRDRILTRRKGQTFASSADELTKTRKKGRKRL